MPSDTRNKRIILVIDDEDEFREAAVNLAQPIIPEDWEIHAPGTLEEAMETIHTRIVRLALIDRNISGDGYQPLSSNKMDVETTSGVQVAAWIHQAFPYIRRAAFSKGGLGCGQFNGHTETKFPLKQHLNQDDHEGDKARDAFRRFIEEQIAYIIATDESVLPLPPKPNL